MKGIDLTKKKDVVIPKSKTKSIPKQETAVDEKAIKVPIDFDSLHNINDFGKTYKQVISFIDNIKKFQNEYLHNMMKSKDELLQFIPENQLSQYHIYLQNHKLCTWDEFAIDIVQKQICDPLRNHRPFYRKQGFELQGLIHDNDKIFLIDTVNKKIFLCLWYRHHYRETIQGWLYHLYCNLSYSNGYVFEILPTTGDTDENGKYFTREEDVFRVRVNLSSNKILTHDQYARIVTEGGWGFDRFYSSGSSGQEVYDFCMKTNTFKQFNEKESQYSSWRGSSSSRTFKY